MKRLESIALDFDRCREELTAAETSPGITEMELHALASHGRSKTNNLNLASDLGGCMLDPITTPLILLAFKEVFGRLIKSAAEDYVKKYFGKVFEAAADWGKKDAVRQALERAYAAWIEMF